MDDSTSNPPLKRCSTCKEWKPATSEFFNRGSAGHAFQYQCKNCQRERERIYRETYPDKIAAKRQKHHEKNREALNEKTRQWRKENPDKAKASVRRYYENNRDAILQKQKARASQSRENNRRRTADWEKRNPEKIKIYRHNRRTRRVNNPSDFTGLDWDRAQGYWGNCCAICGQSANESICIAADHWIPLAKGGGTTVDNILPLCHSMTKGRGGCNSSKGAKDAIQWLSEVLDDEKAANKLKEIEHYFQWAVKQRQQSQ